MIHRIMFKFLNYGISSMEHVLIVARSAELCARCQSTKLDYKDYENLLDATIRMGK